jgi:hypothetical protein
MKEQTNETPKNAAGPAAGEPVPINSANVPAAAADEVAQLKAENTELKAAIKLGTAREQMTALLAAAGARSPVLLFNAVSTELPYTGDGEVSNAAAIVEQLKQRFPEQFGSESGTVSIDGGAGRITSPALTKAALAKMTPAEIAGLDWGAVRQVLSQK